MTSTTRRPTFTSHYLMGPGDRKYVFATAPTDALTVRVRRYERGVCVREWTLGLGKARRLWAWLVNRLGYSKW